MIPQQPLTTVSATGSVGSMIPSVTIFKAITGNSSTGSVGSVGTLVTYTAALTGVSAAGSVGTMSVYYWKPIDTADTPNWINIHTV
jgi:hypothetical protein